ncbi:cobalamin biosynthesis protein [Massilia sp. MB5]|uniref:cobalamin biosynthesis protein n=1 Tax=unclassified Massilia TaxID=2609279 RepID=UPI00067CD0EB|nr:MULTISPECIES: cobalamin biosynthesis protein [unclassified Massilia]AKU20454.1 cobalamin biosynthesis protein CbiG [Massilia sp. NR 4-1]UMR30104.1 cobalamin biosynthesis protein [Massilia sp. MB5]
MTAFTVGLGCDRGVLLETVREAVQAALAAAGATREQVAAAATITLKKDEAALLALAEEYGWPLHFYEAEQLAVVPVPHPSETVRRYTGTPSVSEAAALLAAGPDTPMSALLVEKHKLRGADGRNATVSIARKNP